MKEKQRLKNPVAKFIILSNIIFIPLFLLTGITMMLGFPKVVFDIMLCIASWSSTFAFLILFKRLYPGQSIIVYIRAKFKNKVNWKTIVNVVLIQSFIFICIIYAIRIKDNVQESAFTVSSVGMLIYFFFKNLFAGPLGEELGWRGFVGQELQKKYSPLKSAIIIGFGWGIWHAPIWLTTGLIGKQLIMYIVLFMASVIAISIIMTAFYNLNKNLIIPIIIHQLFNFFIGLLNGNIIELLGLNAFYYSIMAIILIVINPKYSLYSTKE